MVPYPVSVNKTSYTEMLMEHMLPLIRAKFPGDVNGRRITVQQDNAPPTHIQPGDTEWCQAVAASGWKFQLPASDIPPLAKRYKTTATTTPGWSWTTTTDWTTSRNGYTAGHALGVRASTTCSRLRGTWTRRARGAVRDWTNYEVDGSKADVAPPERYVLHIHATFKLNISEYPVIVIGISDRARSFHLVALFIVSQRLQQIYESCLAALTRVYSWITQLRLLP